MVGHLAAAPGFVGELVRAARVGEGYLAGESLAARLKREGKLALPDTATLLLPVISAVGAAHAVGIVHRDPGQREPPKPMLVPGGLRV